MRFQRDRAPGRPILNVCKQFRRNRHRGGRFAVIIRRSRRDGRGARLAECVRTRPSAVIKCPIALRVEKQKTRVEKKKCYTIRPRQHPEIAGR